MQKLLITTKLPQKGIDELKKFFEVEIKTGLSEEQLIEMIAPFEILLIRSETKVTKAVIDAASNLKIVGRAGVGLDNVDLETAKSKGIKVLNTPNANSLAVAELIFGIALVLYRKIREADASLKKGEWIKSQLLGNELNAKTIGIVGVGKIGQIVAKIAQAFGMKVIGFDPYVTQEQLSASGVQLETDLNNLLKKADIVTLHLPKTKETAHLLGAEEFKIMRKNALVINCARGGIIDEEAFVNALINGEIAGAGIDTWETEPLVNEKLRTLSNVVALPHIGASTAEAQDRCVSDLIESILASYKP